MEKLYERINWEGKPSKNTPINSTNLNIIDKAIDDLDDRIIEISQSSAGGGLNIVPSYIVGNVAYASNWLSDEEDGAVISPSDGFLYVIQTRGEYFGCVVYWDGDQSAYRTFGRKNVLTTDTNKQLIKFGGEKTYWLPSGTQYQLYNRTVISIPLEEGSIIRANIHAAMNQCNARVGIEGTSDYKTYSAGIGQVAFDYVMDIVVTEEMCLAGNPFTLWFNCKAVSGQGYSISEGSYVIVDNGTTGYETMLYVPPTKLKPGYSGLVPPAEINEMNSVLMSDGKWHTLQELKELLNG